MTVTQTEAHALPDQMYSDANPASGRWLRWLLPALAIAGAVAAVLVVSGVVAPSLLIYAAVIGGSGLMHVFGHGGHGGHEGGSPPAKR